MIFGQQVQSPTKETTTASPRGQREHLFSNQDDYPLWDNQISLWDEGQRLSRFASSSLERAGFPKHGAAHCHTNPLHIIHQGSAQPLWALRGTEVNVMVMLLTVLWAIKPPVWKAHILGQHLLHCGRLACKQGKISNPSQLLTYLYWSSKKSVARTLEGRTAEKQHSGKMDLSLAWDKDLALHRARFSAQWPY